MWWRLTKRLSTPRSENETRDLETVDFRDQRREVTTMRKRIAIVIAALLVLVALAAATGLTSASATSSAEGLQLDGTWMVTVTRINPPPGLAPTFNSLLSYTRGGVMIETSSLAGANRRSPALGQWERIGNDLFATSMWFFRSDPATGANLGTQEVDRTVRLSADGDSFTAVAVVQQFDVDGNPVGGQLHATEVGERLAINPNPDQP
jgi:hypothetical protein